MPVRADLADAHRLAWEHIAAPGSWWSGDQRVELAGTALLGDRRPRSPAPVGPRLLDRPASGPHRAAWPRTTSLTAWRVTPAR